MLAPQATDRLQIFGMNDPDQVEVLDLLPAPFEIRQNDEPLREIIRIHIKWCFDLFIG
jgi:hypothetical protein